MSDVWNETDAAPALDPSSGGISMNQAFSVDVVFRLGWAAVQRNPGVAAAAGGTLAALQFGPSILQQFGGLAGGDEIMALAVAVIGMFVSLFAAVYQQFVLAGTYVSFAAVARGEEADLGTVFTGGRVGLNVLLANLLLGIALGIAVLVLYGPGLGALVAGAVFMIDGDGSSTPLLLAGSLWLIAATPVFVYLSVFAPLVPVAAALEPIGPIDAVSRAWERIHGARLTLFVTSLVFAFAQFAACCLGFVGLIPLLAVFHGGLAASWLLANRPLDELRKSEFFQENAGDLLR